MTKDDLLINNAAVNNETLSDGGTTPRNNKPIQTQHNHLANNSFDSSGFGDGPASAKNARTTDDI